MCKGIGSEEIFNRNWHTSGLAPLMYCKHCYKYQHFCSHCKEEFYSEKSKGVEFCSTKCRVASHRVELKPSHHTCVECGKSFTPKSEKAKFCKNSCRQKNHRKSIKE